MKVTSKLSAEAASAHFYGPSALECFPATSKSYLSVSLPALGACQKPLVLPEDSLPAYIKDLSTTFSTYS